MNDAPHNAPYVGPIEVTEGPFAGWMTWGEGADPYETAIGPFCFKVDADGRAFDLVTFGQSFHWVDAEVAVPRLAGLVRQPGRVVLLWNKLRPSSPSNDELRAASPDYVNVDAVSSDPSQADAALAELRGRFTAAGFSVTEREDSWTETQPGEHWLDLIFTYSAHSTLPEDRRAALRAALAEVIGERDVTIAASTIALIAQR